MKSLQDITIHYVDLGQYTPKPKKQFIDKFSKRQVETFGIMACNVLLLGFFLWAHWNV